MRCWVDRGASNPSVSKIQHMPYVPSANGKLNQPPLVFFLLHSLRFSVALSQLAPRRDASQPGDTGHVDPLVSMFDIGYILTAYVESLVHSLPRANLRQVAHTRCAHLCTPPVPSCRTSYSALCILLGPAPGLYSLSKASFPVWLLGLRWCVPGRRVRTNRSSTLTISHNGRPAHHPKGSTEQVAFQYIRQGGIRGVSAVRDEIHRRCVQDPANHRPLGPQWPDTRTRRDIREQLRACFFSGLWGAPPAGRCAETHERGRPCGYTGGVEFCDEQWTAEGALCQGMRVGTRRAAPTPRCSSFNPPGPSLLMLRRGDSEPILMLHAGQTNSIRLRTEPSSASLAGKGRVSPDNHASATPRALPFARHAAPHLICIPPAKHAHGVRLLEADCHPPPGPSVAHRR
jgi:hypothetical protein